METLDEHQSGSRELALLVFKAKLTERARAQTSRTEENHVFRDGHPAEPTRLFQPGDDLDAKLSTHTIPTEQFGEPNSDTTDHTPPLYWHEITEPIHVIRSAKSPRNRVRGIAAGAALVATLLASSAPHATPQSESTPREQNVSEAVVALPTPEPSPTPSIIITPETSSTPTAEATSDPSASIAAPEAPALPPAPTPEAPTLVPSPPLTLDLTTQNLYSKKNKKAVDAVEYIINNSDIAGFQEVKPWVWGNVAPRLFHCGAPCEAANGGYYPKDSITRKMSTNMIVWDEAKFDKVEEGFDYLNPEIDGLEKGGGGYDIGQRLLPHVTLVQVRPPNNPGEIYDKEPIYIVAWVNHPIASAESNGTINDDNPKRASVRAIQMQNTRNAIVIHRQLHPYARRLDIVLEDGNFNIPLNNQLFNNADPNDNDPTSPIANYVVALGMTSANLQPGAPQTGTLPKKPGRGDIDGIYVGSPNNTVGITFNSFGYYPPSGPNGGSLGSDHLGVGTNITAQ